MRKLASDPVLDCAAQTIRTEGVAALWKGQLAYIVRIAPHAVITLLAIDAINAGLRAWRG